MTTLVVGGDGLAMMIGADGLKQCRATGVAAVAVSKTIRDAQALNGGNHVHCLSDANLILDVVHENGYQLTTSRWAHEVTWAPRQSLVGERRQRHTENRNDPKVVIDVHRGHHTLCRSPTHVSGNDIGAEPR